jgi:hypothetical protein
MQDKSFQQAVQELQGSLSNGFQDALCRMISYRTTVTNATSDIQDEKVRTMVTKTLIVGQMTVLLAMMRDMQMLNDVQYNEFVAYLMQTCNYQPHDALSVGRGDTFLSEPNQSEPNQSDSNQ